MEDIIVVEDDVVEAVGKENLRKLTGNKRMPHRSMKEKIRNKVKVEILDLYKLIRNKELLESLKDQPDRLVVIYRLISKLSDYFIRGRDKKDEPLSSLKFVLADDQEFYSPSEVRNLQIDVERIPQFLEVIIGSKKLLHPDVARDADAINQLARCGLEVLNRQTIVRKLEEVVNTITDRSKCPATWTYPEDLIKATLFIASETKPAMDRLVAQDATLQSPSNLFVPNGQLDWQPLWNAQLLPGFRPIHRSYFVTESYAPEKENLLQILEDLGVHGFRRERDKPLVETAAYAISRERLKDTHNLADVTQRHILGYDFQCQGHCQKVFEIKGMGEPDDLTLEESETTAAQQKLDDYILICVYNLPTHPDRVGFKEIPNPPSICRPIGKSKVPKSDWLSIAGK